MTTSIAIGEVLAFHVSAAVAGRSPSGKLTVDPVALAPVARCGGVTYARCTELYEIGRPDGQGRYPGEAAGKKEGEGGKAGGAGQGQGQQGQGQGQKPPAAGASGG